MMDQDVPSRVSSWTAWKWWTTIERCWRQIKMWFCKFADLWVSNWVWATSRISKYSKNIQCCGTEKFEDLFFKLHRTSFMFYSVFPFFSLEKLVQNFLWKNALLDFFFAESTLSWRVLKISLLQITSTRTLSNGKPSVSNHNVGVYKWLANLSCPRQSGFDVA